MTHDRRRRPRYGVYSEVGKLRKVMVCRPGLAHLRLTPDNCHDLLFDDVIWVHGGAEGALRFCQLMRERGIDVLEMHDLLADDARRPGGARLAARPQDQRQHGGAASVWKSCAPGWTRCPPAKLAEHLIGGIATSEMPVDAVHDPARAHRPDPLRRAAAAEHAVYPRHHLLDLWRRQPQPDVLAGPAPGDAADDGDLQVPSRASRTPSSTSGSAIRTSTTAPRPWRAATSCRLATASSSSAWASAPAIRPCARSPRRCSPRRRPSA